MPKKDSQEKNIQVVVRCRPRNNQEIKDGSPSIIECLPNKKEVNVKHDIADKSCLTKTFGFDRVFDQKSTQLDIYRYVVCPLLEEVLLGYNCTVFAYGQTGTGKTFTMEGEKSTEGGSWDQEPQAGIIPRAMQQLFERLQALPDCEFSVRVSFLEIYNEDLFDLLGSSLDSQKLRIFEDSAKKGSVFVQGLEETIVRDKDEVYDILERGRAKRQTAATLMNAHSSRSHSLFSVTVHIKESSVTGEEMLKTGKLNLVDLAGSENVGRSGAVDKRLREAGTINQSLLTLGRVITALVERAPHVPYRESKLTRLLQDSLGGRTKTSIIATISPAACNVEETLSTLDYAHRAKNILNRPEINQKLTKKALIKEYTEEIDKLKKDLMAAREKNGIFLAVENYNDLLSRLKSKTESLIVAEDKLTHMETEFAKVSELFRDTSEELSGTKEELEKTSNKLQTTRANLKKTIEDRDGINFVSKMQDLTEEDLFSRSAELLGAMRNACGDIDKLHTSLERKVMVEENNALQKEAYRSHFSNSVKSLQQCVLDYYEEQKQKCKERLQWLDDQMSEKNELVARQSAFLDEMFARRRQMIEKIVDNEKTHVERCIQWKESVSHFMATKKEEAVELFALLTSDEWNEAMNCTKETMNISKSVLEDIKSFTGQQIAELEKKTNEFLEQNRDMAQVIKEQLESQAKQAQALLKKQERQRNHYSEIQKILETCWEEEQETTTQICADTSTVTENCKRMLQKRAEQDLAFATNMSSYNQKTSFGIDDRLEKISRGLDRNAGLFPYVENTAEHVATRGARMIEEWQQSLDDFLTNNETCISEKLSVVQQDSQECLTNSTSNHDTLSVNLKSDQQKYLNLVTSSQESTNDTFEDLGTMTSVLCAKAGDMDGGMANFLNVNLVEDAPSGATPVRQNYRYPTQLPRTEDRTTLLQLFKESYKVPTTPQLDRRLETENQEFLEKQSDNVFADQDDDLVIKSSCPSDSKHESVSKQNGLSVQNTKLLKQKSAEPLITDERSPLRVANRSSEVVKRSKITRGKNISKSH